MNRAVSNRENNTGKSDFRQKCGTICFSALFFFLLLQTAFVENTTGVLKTVVSYFDDVIICIFACALIPGVVLRKSVLSAIERVMIIAFSIFMALGFVSSIVNRMQPLTVVLTDAVSCARFFVLFLTVRISISGQSVSRQTVKVVGTGCRIIIAVIGVLILHDLLFDPFFEKDNQSFSLFFASHTELAACCISCGCAIILSCSVKEKIAVSDCVFTVLALLCSCASMRTKAYGAAIIIFSIWIAECVLVVKPVYELLAGSVAAAGAGVLASDKLRMYYLNNIPTARNVMFKDSITLASKYFPLGTGFGTFGSSAAFKNSSPLYYELGYPDFLEAGLNPWNAFLCDGFWQIVIAQTGWIGTACFLVIIFGFVFLAFVVRKNNRIASCAMLSILIYLLISSFGETAFFHPMLGSLFLLLPLAVNLFGKRILTV